MLEEQKAQFLDSIQNFYDREKKYDLMPRIRVTIKGKDLENKRKLIKPLQEREHTLPTKVITNKNKIESKRESKNSQNIKNYNPYSQNLHNGSGKFERYRNNINVIF